MPLLCALQGYHNTTVSYVQLSILPKIGMVFCLI